MRVAMNASNLNDHDDGSEVAIAGQIFPGFDRVLGQRLYKHLDDARGIILELIRSAFLERISDEANGNRLPEIMYGRPNLSDVQAE